MAAGIESSVVDPSSLQVDRRARRKKTDAIDVETILRALIGWESGERGLCRMVRVPDAAAEDARRASRERERLVREQTGHINRIRGLLMTMGIYDFNPRLAVLVALITGDGRKLPPRLSVEIGREIERLQLVEHQIAELERERDPAQPRGRPGRGIASRWLDPDSPPARMAHLRQLRGVGPQIAGVLHSEVSYRHFGNRRARHAAVELAWLWLHWQPDTALARWFRTRVGAATSRLKRIMIVALARKLLIALWRFLEWGLVPDGATLKA